MVPKLPVQVALQTGDRVLQDLLLAILVSLWFLAPLAILLRFNWRAAVFGPVAFICLGVFPLTMLAAGNSGWHPGPSPIPFMLACWAVAAVVFVVSVYLIGPTWGKRHLGFLLGTGVAIWMITFYPMAETFWAVVGTPK
jgi:hypothetical protein